MVRPAGLMMSPASGSSMPASILSSVVLPAPFGPQRPDALAVVDLPGDGVEEDAIAERLGEAGELDHVRLALGGAVCGSAHRPCARARAPTQTSNCTMRRRPFVAPTAAQSSSCQFVSYRRCLCWPCGASGAGLASEDPMRSRPACRCCCVPARCLRHRVRGAGAVRQRDVHRVGRSGPLVHRADRGRRLNRLPRPDAGHDAPDDDALARCADDDVAAVVVRDAGLHDSVLAGLKPPPRSRQSAESSRGRCSAATA